MYKTDYKMRFIGDYRMFNLTTNQLYIVKYIDNIDKRYLVVNDLNKLTWYRMDLFETDILEERKDKIKILKEKINGCR